MHDLTQPPQNDPAFLYRRRDELYTDDMLIAAIGTLDLFTWLDGRAATIDDIATHYGFERRPVDVMTTLFVAMGLLTRDGAALALTDLSREYLVTSSRWFMGPYFPKPADRPIARDLLEILRTGRPANFFSRADEQDWHRAMETEKVAEEFTAAMDCRGRLLAQALATHLDLGEQPRLLDIAGGSGIYACALAAHTPGLTGAVLEKAPVDRIAARAIAQRGFTDRLDVLTGDMLAAPLPEGYDTHLFSNVLHDWDTDIVQQLIAASAQALPAGGRIVVHDAYLNADKTGPLPIAAYSVLLMHVTQGRCYSTAEMAGWLRDAGFDAPTDVPSAIGRSALVARRR